MDTRTTINTLGYAGLIPFVATAILIAAGSAYSDIAAPVADLYAFGIICFLTGTWWGVAIGDNRRNLILLSNLYFLVAFLALVFAPAWWPLFAALLLLAIFAIEQVSLPTLPRFYRRMRSVLTIVAGCSMAVIYIST